ncbi:hypothetical protein C8R46DRAFT_1222424 [Mycena filopes]|nr:hypothetical protein C8R46DRAFT_1222424 [Mycena filopes]
MDGVQSELIRDLVKRVSGASLSLWMPFTSTCFKTESATSTVHSYRHQRHILIVASYAERPSLHPSSTLKATWTPFELTCIKLPSGTSPARPYRLLTPGTTDSASSTDPQSHLDAVQFDLLRIPDTNTASRSSRATRSMPCLQSLQELSSKLTPGWRLTSAGVTDFKYCFTLLPNGSLRLQAHQPHGFGDYARISHQYKVLNLESR